MHIVICKYSLIFNDIGRIIEHKAVTTANKWVLQGAVCRLLWYELEGDSYGANSNVAQSLLCRPGLIATLKSDPSFEFDIEIHQSKREDKLTPLLQSSLSLTKDVRNY